MWTKCHISRRFQEILQELKHLSPEDLFSGFLTVPYPQDGSISSKWIYSSAYRRSFVHYRYLEFKKTERKNPPSGSLLCITLHNFKSLNKNSLKGKNLEKKMCLKVWIKKNLPTVYHPDELKMPSQCIREARLSVTPNSFRVYCGR